MSKKLIYALLMIALVVIVLILNTGRSMNLNIGFGEFKIVQALMLFMFTAIGVVIGVLLK